jgi:hypothetical protein
MSRTLKFLVVLTAALAPFGVERLVAQEATEDATHETAPQAAPQPPQAAPQPPPARSQEQPQAQAQPQPAQPQSAQQPEFADPRFAFHRVETGFLRLDLRTGAVSSCSQQATGWACVLVPEERSAVEGEIARLQRENATLKNAMLERGLPLPKGMTPDVPVPPSATTAPSRREETVPRPPQSVPPVASVPSPPKSAESDRAAREDAELERVMTMMEKVWRRLVEMMVTIQRDMQKKG